MKKMKKLWIGLMAVIVCAALLMTGCSDSDDDFSEVTIDKVTFSRDGITLVGNLYKPMFFDDANRYNAVIVQGAMTTVKEQMSSFYADRLVKKNYIVLAFDYSGFGESGGEPRQLESPANKLADLKAATAYLSALKFVKSVGVIGICASGGNVAAFAAESTKAKAVAIVGSWITESPLDAETTAFLGGNERIAQCRQADVTATALYESTGQNTIIPAYSETDITAALFVPIQGAFDYYFNPKRGGVPEWKNQFSVMSWNEWLDFDPIKTANRCTVPLIMIHSDYSHFPVLARKFYDAVNTEKEIWWAEKQQLDFYDNDATVNEVVNRIINFFEKY